MPTKEEAVEVLKNVKDPELDLDVWTLGLIYKIDIANDIINITMTFTTPMCPYGPQLMDNIYNKLKEMQGVKDVKIELTFSPPWLPSAEVRAMLGV